MINFEVLQLLLLYLMTILMLGLSMKATVINDDLKSFIAFTISFGLLALLYIASGENEIITGLAFLFGTILGTGRLAEE
jgi:uncharacterized MnhB-related membrane protein